MRNLHVLNLRKRQEYSRRSSVASARFPLGVPKEVGDSTPISFNEPVNSEKFNTIKYEEIRGEEDEEELEGEKDEEEGEIDEEDEIVELSQVAKKRRCRRKRQRRQSCFSASERYDKVVETQDEINDETEGEELGEFEGEIEQEESVKSYDSTILSAITFIWEDEIYEFEELCDPGTIKNIYKIHHIEFNYYDEFGKSRYLHLCKDLSVTPMSRFYNGLTTKEIDLSFRQINGKNIRAMCAALEFNLYVKKLILRYNKLGKEDCYFLGLLLKNNSTITELDLTGCNIGPENLESLVAHLGINASLEILNLSRNNIQDEGMKVLFPILMENFSISNLDLSHNKLGEESAEMLGQIFKSNKFLDILNLSYNYLFEPKSLKLFFRGLLTNDSIFDLNLSWNGLNGEAVGKYIKIFLRKNSTIKHLDLSSNRLQGLAVTEIKRGVARSKSLKTLKMGKNPIDPDTLETLLVGALACKTLKLLDLEELWFNKSVTKIFSTIPADRNFEVKYGGILENFYIKGPDYLRILLERAQFEAQKPKRKNHKRDFGEFLWSLGDTPISEQEFLNEANRFKVKVSTELLSELAKQFLIPKPKQVDVSAMRDKYLQIYPNSQPPPPSKTKKGKKKGDKAELKKSAEKPLPQYASAYKKLSKRESSSTHKTHKDIQAVSVPDFLEIIGEGNELDEEFENNWDEDIETMLQVVFADDEEQREEEEVEKKVRIEEK